MKTLLLALLISIPLSGADVAKPIPFSAGEKLQAENYNLKLQNFNLRLKELQGQVNQEHDALETQRKTLSEELLKAHGLSGTAYQPNLPLGVFDPVPPPKEAPKETPAKKESK